jgi:hypothetical protein
MLTDGIYGLTIELSRKRRGKLAPTVEALAVLRDGTILGSDPWGGQFTGTYAVDLESGQDTITIKVEVPPDGELVTGFRAGPNGASFDLVAAFDQAAHSHRTTIEIGGKRVVVSVAFIGSLPN